MDKNCYYASISMRQISFKSNYRQNKLVVIFRVNLTDVIYDKPLKTLAKLVFSLMKKGF